MAFKTATVNSSKVAGTLSNYPSYVALNRLGITTLAEAQSLRIYADSGKVVEWAREIVSAVEGHTKVPSLTTTTPIYGDYDGIRADYAVGTTYGRNAVWSDYEMVLHNAGGTDSAGNVSTTANGGVTAGDTAGKLGTATTFDGTDDTFSFTNPLATSLTDTTTIWVKSTKSTIYYPFWTQNPSGIKGLYVNQNFAGDIQYLLQNASGSSGRLNAHTQEDEGIRDGEWHKLTWTAQNSTSTIQLFMDGLLLSINYGATNSYSGINAAGAFIGARGTNSTGFTDGVMDEFRMRSSIVSADWETTEYNNQSDEVTFWGTWADVSPVVSSAFLDLGGL
jgi:hypothetical protein